MLQQRAAHPIKRMTLIELEPIAKKDPSERIRNQLVQTEKGDLAEHAASDALLGQRTQTVDRETVSKNRQTVIGTAVQAKRLSPIQKKASQETASAAKEFSKAGPLSALGLPILPSARGLKQDAASPDSPNWADQAHASEDYVNGKNESDKTLLNTKEYVFFGYFQRIRERLDRAWVPILREKVAKIYRSGRHLASETEHNTRVLVVLNPEGEIVKVKVLNQSGTQDLDDAAIRAFNQAGPFPNPPRGIVDAKGEIEIPWEFILRT